MRLTSLILGASAILVVAACPGQKAAMADLRTKLKRRATKDSGDSVEMIGDLATAGATTDTGKTIQDILLGGTDPFSDEKPTLPLADKDSKKCAADTCCIWIYIAQDMQKAFQGDSGRCNALARRAVRAGFHDAAAWSKSTGGTGADGSLILGDEITRPENAGLEEIIAQLSTWFDQYKKYGIAMADLIQMSATVATVVCPLGPRIRSFVGRKDSSTPAQEGLIPGAGTDADTLLQIFADKTIGPLGLAALVGAHTTSQQRFFDTERALDPQDSTPGVWDVTYYSETIGNAPKRVVRFPSDVALAAHPMVKDEWHTFTSDGGQEKWNRVMLPTESQWHRHANKSRTTPRNTSASVFSALTTSTI